MGTRHVLFPRMTNIWRPTSPVEFRWLSVPRRCVDGQERLPLSIRLRSGAGPGVTTDGFLGETSLLGVTHLPMRTIQTIEVARSEPRCCFVFIQGRHQADKHWSFALNHGSCLLTLNLLFVSGGRPGRCLASRDFGSYCLGLVTNRFSNMFLTSAHTATAVTLCSLSGCEPSQILQRSLRFVLRCQVFLPPH